jgi:hypothetical protein
VFFVLKAGAEASLPALLWAYGVAITPLSSLTLESAGSSDPGFADVLVTIAAQVAAVLMGIDVLVNGLDVRSLLYLCGGTMMIAALVQAAVAFLVTRESARGSARRQILPGG